MKRIVQRAIVHPLITGSMVIFFGTLAGNIFNFLYHLYVIQNLSRVDYGTLASLISIMTLLALIAGAVVPTIVRFAGVYFAQGEVEKARGLYMVFLLFSSLFGLVILVFFSLFSSPIADFFKINQPHLIVITGVLVLLGFLSVVNTGFLQAKLNFGYITFSNFCASIFKFVFGVLFIIFKLGITGALWAFVLSSIISYIVTLIPLKFIFKKGFAIPNINKKELFVYGAPSAITLFGLTSLISTDIILVKHFFTPDQAGTYATLSLVGKVIFYFSGPIGIVMFPLVVQKHAKEENYRSVFFLSLFLVFVASALLTLFYYLFPRFTILFFTRSHNLEAEVSLAYFGVFISLYSLLYVVTNFFLSIGKTRVFIPIIFGAIIQVILILFFHESFTQVITISIATVSLLLLTLLLYYLHLQKHEKS